MFNRKLKSIVAGDESSRLLKTSRRAFASSVEKSTLLKAMVLLYLAVIEYSRKNPEAAEKYLEARFKEAPDPPVGQTSMKKIEGLSRAEREQK